MTRNTQTPFQHLLLATDLSARCDRAQDRALRLASEWNAKLTVVHALDVREIPHEEMDKIGVAGAEARALVRLAREFREVKDVVCALKVREGRPVDVVLDIAREERCDMIVTGIAGNNPLGQVLLGSTTSGVARRTNSPVLVVKNRAREAYSGAVVASDLAEASMSALTLAARMFQPSQLTLFHAFDLPFRGILDNKRAYDEERRLSVQDEAKRFVAGCFGAAAKEVNIRTQDGDPVRLLDEYVTKQDVDLVMVGTHGWTAITQMMAGSVAAAILEKVPCDVLIVPSRGARPAT